MRPCARPHCLQDASGLRTDGLCFGHGKAADGLLELRPEHPYDRYPRPMPRRVEPWPRLRRRCPA